MCQHVWEHYAYSGDRAYLARAYGIMKEAARFYLDFLVEEPEHGWLVTAPTISPENAFRTPEGQARLRDLVERICLVWCYHHRCRTGNFCNRAPGRAERER